MQIRLRELGNSLGAIFPSSALKQLNAHSGDTLEIEVKRVIRPSRAGWDNPETWHGSAHEELFLEEIHNNRFDEEWEW